MAFEDLTGLNLESLSPTLMVLIVVTMIWKFIWYGFALYKSAFRKQKIWFVVLFITLFLLNDIGILAILYIFVFSKLGLKNKKSKSENKKIESVKSKKKKK